MQIRSRIPTHFWSEQLTKVALADWPTLSSFASLQIAKETFTLRHPFGAKHGRGDDVQQVSLRITDMCNLRCHTCGQWGDNGYLHGKSLKELRKNEVPVATYKRMVDQIVAEGWSPGWYIWGGEPMLYDGLLDLLYYIAARDMPIMMVSNGTHLAEHAKEIVDTCKILWVSVDGPTADIHNEQRPGLSKGLDNFKMVKEALAAVSEEKHRRNSLFPFIAPISVIARYNIDHLVDIYRFTSHYADAHIFYLSWWIDPESAADHTADFQARFGFEPKTHLGWIGDWKDFDHQLILDKFEEMYALMNQTETTNGQQKCVPLMYPHLSSNEQIQQYYEDHRAVFGYTQCISIYMTMEVDSNGDVSLCRDYHDYIIGNIKTDSIVDIWRSKEAETFRRSISNQGLMPACRRCCGLMGY